MGQAQNKIKALKLVAKAAVYSRYSSEMQASCSCQDQIDRIADLAKNDQVVSRQFTNHKIAIAPDWICTDEAVSGRKAGRWGYQKILKGIREKAFDLLLVDDLSRLTRDLGGLLDLYQLLKHHDIELISVSDRLSSLDPNAKIFFTVRGMISDFGNDIHAERTLRGMEARARNLFSTGQKPHGYGSRPTITENRKGKEVKSHFEIFIIPEQAETVQKIFKLYSEGFGVQCIAKKLNEEKIPPPRPNAHGWQTGPIHRFLTNEKYIGKWVFKKHTFSTDPDTGKRVKKPRPRHEWIEKHCEALRIIPQTIWDKVQSILAENQKTAQKRFPKNPKATWGNKGRVDNRYLLSGSLKCHKCNGALVTVSGRSGGYYGCVNANRHGTCDNRFLTSRVKLERAFIQYLSENIVPSTEVIEYATQKFNALVRQYLQRGPTRKNELETELKKITTELNRLVEFIVQGNVSEAVAGAIKQRETRKTRISEELASLARADDKKLFITPHYVQSRLAEMVKNLSSHADKYNGLVREILQEPLIIEKLDNKYRLKGMLNLGNILCSDNVLLASPTGFEPVCPP